MNSPSLIQKGRRLLIIVIVMCLGTTVTIDIHLIMHFGLWKLARNLPATCIKGILCYFLYDGKAWARWVLGSLMVLDGTPTISSMIYSAFTCSTTMSLIEFPLCAGAFLYFYSGMALFLSRSIPAFMKEQKSKRFASV